MTLSLHGIDIRTARDQNFRLERILDEPFFSPFSLCLQVNEMPKMMMEKKKKRECVQMSKLFHRFKATNELMCKNELMTVQDYALKKEAK